MSNIQSKSIISATPDLKFVDTFASNVGIISPLSFIAFDEDENLYVELFNINYFHYELSSDRFYSSIDAYYRDPHHVRWIDGSKIWFDENEK